MDLAVVSHEPPPSPSTLREAALAARARQDWPELLNQASRMQHQSPDEPVGFVWAAAALLRLRRRPVLKALLADALQRFPEHPQLLALAAGRPAARPAPIAADPRSLRTAIEAGARQADWPLVATLCARLRAADPDQPLGYQMGARAWRSQKRAGRAEAVSRAGIERFPTNPGMLLERAITLRKQKRLDEALDCYQRLRQLQPDNARGHAHAANVLVLLGRFDDAETLLQHAVDRLGDKVDLLLQRAVVATRRIDFPLARARLAELRRLVPDDRRLASYTGALTLAEQLHAIAGDAAPTPEPDADPDSGELTDAQVMKRFESLGGNCEFGLAQRAAGAEPLGLLRFAAIATDGLIALLRSGLDGVGSAANTALSLTAQQEYMLDDRFFRTHTLVSYGDADEAELLAKLRRRTAFLRDKLLAEIRKGGKVLVFRPADGVLAEPEIAALHAALRTLGPARLLCVRNAAAGADPVALADRGDGLLVATLPAHDGKLGLGLMQAELYPHWIALCRATLAAMG